MDHENVRFLAHELASVPGIQLDPGKVATNILIFDVSGTGIPSSEISRRLAAKGVLANGVTSGTMRMVTHYDVDRAGCERAVRVMREVVVPLRAATLQS